MGKDYFGGMQKLKRHRGMEDPDDIPISTIQRQNANASSKKNIDETVYNMVEKKKATWKQKGKSGRGRMRIK